MGSGSSKTKPDPPPPKPPSSKEPSIKDEPRQESQTADSSSLPKSEVKGVGANPSSSTSLEHGSGNPSQQQTATASVSGSGSSVTPAVQNPEAEVGSAESSPPSGEVVSASRNTEKAGEAGAERGGGEKDAGKVAPPTDPVPAAASTDQEKEASSNKETMKAATPQKAKKKGEEEEDERLLPEESQQQSLLDTSLRTTNALVRQDGLMKAVGKDVAKLTLRRALPRHISLRSLVTSMQNLEVLDVSDQELGPQGVRLLCLGLTPSCPLVSLSLAGNKTDTDTADSVGRLLTKGPPLEYLDVSSNYLGKDYFSRCAGEALKTNTSLRTLRAQSIGMVDARVLLEGIQANSTLVELDLSNNQITDRQALGVALAAVLKKADCSLQSLALAGCNMDSTGLSALCEGLSPNTSLHALNVSNNEFGSLKTLMLMAVTAFSHPALINLHLNDARLSDQTLTADVPRPARDVVSRLEVLSMNSSNLTDEFWSKLTAVFKGKLPSLMDVDVSNNAKLTAVVMEHVWGLSADDSGRSGIHKLTTAMNDMNGLPSQVTVSRFPRLAYLNTRKVRFSSDAFCALADLAVSGGLPLATLVLDGIKLSGKKGLTALLGNCASSHITALSLSGCSLTDADLSPLAAALGSGFKVQMVKLSANRLTDAMLTALAESLLKCRQHPLGVLDISGNQIKDTGVKALCQVYSSKSHTPSLHSVNLASNAVGKEGVVALLSCMGKKSPLKCLYLNNQSSSFLESDMEDIYVKAALVLGYTVKRSGETIEAGCSDLPSLPAGFSINLRGLGGYAGQLGPFLDCPAILTDASSQRLMTLTFDNVLDLCASLQGQKSDAMCAVSKDDWVHITGCDKDNSIPSWLQLADSRSKGVYLCNLPGNSTSQRLEGLLETEADCNIEEVFLVKDPVSRNNAGTAWALFSDQPSVDRAMDLYHSGQAQVFGTPFTISRLQVNVEDSVSAEASEKARRDVAARQKARAAEDRATRQLIQQNTEESWKRHAYRLAHPAYADGRIW
ncbi:uncharacterized protein LOC143277925 [Babylonia areolata]|uniref:uncharacterized protein LOC143277925 n=1 Tax=Babylonia areolata TaxID=304850 RepID=UPI003FD33C44